MALGEPNVEGMLRAMTGRQFRMWEMYAEVEPFGEVRADYRAASIVQMIYNVNRGKDVKPIKLEQCLLKFDEPIEPKPKTWKDQLAVVKMIAIAHGAPSDIIKDAPVAKVVKFPSVIQD